MEGESFYETWEHFKMLIKKCSHKIFIEWMRLQIIYNVLDANTRSGLEGAIGGAFMKTTYEDVYEIIEIWN